MDQTAATQIPSPARKFGKKRDSSVILLSLACVVGFLVSHYQQVAKTAPLPQSVFISRSSHTVLPPNAFRASSFDSFFNPTNTTPPFFQIFDKEFLAVLGSTPFIREVASNDTFAFAHEAPIWNPSTNDVFFASNDGGYLGLSDLENNNVVSKINLKDVEKALAQTPSGPINVPITQLALSDDVQMTNGGTGMYKNKLMLITSGRGSRAPSIVLVDPESPHNTTVILNNYFGRQFNSLNDIRAFAYVDAGVPDGIQVDNAGRVYAGCGDGVHVWNFRGTLIGKIFLGSMSANLVFAGNKLVILAETKIFVASIAAKDASRNPIAK